MNVLKNDKQLAILKALVEGNSIRSVERMTGVHRDTIMRLMQRTAANCQHLLHTNMRMLRPKSLQLDEIWGYVYKKDEHMTRVERREGERGDQYTFVALDPETKLVPYYEIGKRDALTTASFVKELCRRIDQNHVLQITTDGFPPYATTIPATFGMAVHFAQLIKHYGGGNEDGVRRYSPPPCTGISTKVICGDPDERRVSTSLVERHNLSMRMCLRRLTRLTNGFSKSLENMKAAMAIYFAYYNFVRVHPSVKMTPAMAAGLRARPLQLQELIA